MAYATITDMIDRFGESEMIRLSTPDGADLVAVVPDPIDRALDEASALIDTYLRRRYRMPLTVAPPEVRRACCILARYDLSTGGQRNPSEQIQAGQQQIVSWLKAIAQGTVHLDLDEVPIGDQSYAQSSSREPVYGGGYGGSVPSDFWDQGL
ncbi:gp436 family protein [Acidiphilium multivorum]|uniref:gp436 family protein n=1 Tax=Acidiphilium multivorum TaxID=62140 RepID=UPI001B8D2166|nr:DUF1320 domain-containing protein [Acidiphilium multivorum]MBS3025347.1 DUF1320 domain-containing protein [Acidiphilium multivorum]